MASQIDLNTLRLNYQKMPGKGAEKKRAHLVYLSAFVERKIGLESCTSLLKQLAFPEFPNSLELQEKSERLADELLKTKDWTVLSHIENLAVLIELESVYKLQRSFYLCIHGQQESEDE